MTRRQAMTRRATAATRAATEAIAGRATDPIADACACGRLRRASRALTQLYDDAMGCAGLRVTQFSLLRTLAREGPTTIGALAENALTERTALARNLDILADQGLVAIRKGRDARTRVASITRAGEKAIAEAMPHWHEAQRKVGALMGEEKLAALIQLLRDLESLHPAFAHDGDASNPAA